MNPPNFNLHNGQPLHPTPTQYGEQTPPPGNSYPSPVYHHNYGAIPLQNGYMPINQNPPEIVPQMRGTQSIDDMLGGMRIGELQSSQHQRDEAIARVLQYGENRKAAQTQELASRDEEYARRLVMEEADAIRRERELQAQKEREKREKEEAEKQDMLLAKKLQEEEAKNLQVRKDFAMARKLEKEENAREEAERRRMENERRRIRLQHDRERIQREQERIRRENYAKMLQRESISRQHMVYVHNNNCGCYSYPLTQYHLSHVHGMHCQCEWSGSNRGRYHLHNSSCCTINHRHTRHCWCSYLHHRHTNRCCTIAHRHSEACRCICK